MGVHNARLVFEDTFGASSLTAGPHWSTQSPFCWNDGPNSWIDHHHLPQYLDSGGSGGLVSTAPGRARELSTNAPEFLVLDLTQAPAANANVEPAYVTWDYVRVWTTAAPIRSRSRFLG